MDVKKQAREGTGKLTPMIESSCNLDFDFTGALGGRGRPCVLLLIAMGLDGRICSLPRENQIAESLTSSMNAKAIDDEQQEKEEERGGQKEDVENKRVAYCKVV
jgi:hypothetical protein